jgi:hypothetical protein
LKYIYYIGLESIKGMIQHVAGSMSEEEKSVRKLHSLVYALCIIHCARNAGIQKSNLRSLCVQWAKCGNTEDASRKIDQLRKAGIEERQLAYMIENAHDVTYVGLNGRQGLGTNFEVVSGNTR